MKDPIATKFFLLTFLLSWGLLAWLVPSGLDPSSPSYLLFMLGGFGPTLVGIILTAIHEGRKGLGDLWRRTVRFRFGFQWYLIIFLLFPAINAITLLVKDVASGLPPHFSLVLSLTTSPNLILPFLLSIFITGPLAEEYGWRGYALDRLQARVGPATASLLLGIPWALWHLPLFFMNGAPQHSYLHPPDGSGREDWSGDDLRIDPVVLALAPRAGNGPIRGTTQIISIWKE